MSNIERHIEKTGGPQNSGSDYSGSRRQSTDEPQEERIFGLDDLYAKKAKQFEFEGETFKLLKVGHEGQVSKDFLTAMNIRPQRVLFEGKLLLKEFYDDEFENLGVRKYDNTNNFFLMGIAFLDREPAKELGLTLRRTILGRLSEVHDDVDLVFLLKGMDEHAKSLEVHLNRDLDKMFGTGTVFQKRKGIAGFLGGREFVGASPESPRGRNPHIVGAELRFYYGQNDAQNKPSDMNAARDIVVLKPTDLNLDLRT